MTLATLGGIAGGIGLFLLGMWLMTDGLKTAAGPALQRILARFTGTRLRGLASGMLVTAVVQSSSAVTMAAIGFVNAGLLNLRQSMWVLFGANVGTTMTGWLVALVGLSLKVEALALPLVGAGMLLRLSDPKGRRGALGVTLAGFGVLFIGIATLQQGFAGQGQAFALPQGMGEPLNTVAHVIAGALLTVLMQSSSAAIAVALSAAQGLSIGLHDAAAVVIGANVGTTVKALLAAMGATPNAKRAAAAHVVFNLLTAAAAIAALPWLVDAILALGAATGIGEEPAAVLALFHTLFNVAGVIFVWPIADRLSSFLERRFRSAEEDASRPRFLDRHAAAVPQLALDAMGRELDRMAAMTWGIALRALRARGAEPGRLPLAREIEALRGLDHAFGDFVTLVNRESMPGDVAARITRMLYASRYLETTVEAAEHLDAAHAERGAPAPETVGGALAAFVDDAAAAIDRCARPDGPDPGLAGDDTLARLHRDYLETKERLLEAGALGQLPIVEMDRVLRGARLTWRLADQAVHAAIVLRQIRHPDEEPDRGLPPRQPSEAVEQGGSIVAALAEPAPSARDGADPALR
ncbi:Na/Pi symporter [Burkholderiaceae bacterium FT117]|uniref:Na/Pi cotransporter family protein n=1 Tax=Zeimonas sediminis TaxID=2944268 RepID=UPI0023431592|nr:Na/Pi symporter [Zeimonas sediminis]MCM5569081.1 Na/Pi symporter [Zeimonas sediminis]